MGNVTGRPGREILAVDRKSGDVLVVFDGEVVGRIKAKSGKPFVDVATIGAIKPLDLTERHMAARFTPINDIRLGKAGDASWRVDTLTFANGGEGLFNAYNCLFTIPNYWDLCRFLVAESVRIAGQAVRRSRIGERWRQPPLSLAFVLGSRLSLSHGGWTLLRRVASSSARPVHRGRAFLGRHAVGGSLGSLVQRRVFCTTVQKRDVDDSRTP